VSREILVEAAEAAGVAEGKLAAVLDRPPSFFERASRERNDYLAFVRASLYQQAAEGSFVYHGHDGHRLLGKLSNVLRIRVVAPLAFRVAAVQADLGLDEKKAERHIAKVDERRAKWARFLHGVAWDDPLLYDLIVNLEKVSVDEAATMLVTLARAERYAWTPALEQRAADEALAARVLAQLSQAEEARGTDLQIEAAGGVVRLGGAVRYDETRRAIGAAVAAVEGVEEIRNEMTIPSDTLRS
jgi:cytidylate kinase